MPGDEATAAALEQAILANPYDRNAYMVYGDWLQQHGDPRGELIALQLANKNASALVLLDRHANAFYGPLAAHKKTYDGKKSEAFSWKNGFIHAARLSHDSYADEAFHGKLVDILEQLIAHPSGRFLVELTLVFNGDPNENDLQDLIDLLATRAPPTLRKLHLGDFEYFGEDTEMSWYHVGNLGRLWRGVPGLTHLVVQGGEFQLGTIDAPNLKSAAFRTGGLSQDSARAIASAKWPQLEDLEIWYGDDNYGGDATVEDVRPLLARTDLSALRRLGLMNAQFTDDLCAILPTAPLARQLRELDLSLGCMTDEGAEELAEAEGVLHLDKLDVSENYLSDAGVRRLRGVAKTVNSKDQRDDDDPEYRHPAVGE